MKTVQMFTKISLKNGFRGAQVKTWDFYQHLRSHDGLNPFIAFHPDSQWSPDLPWTENQVLGKQVIVAKPDFYFFKGGNDWRLFTAKHPLNSNAQIISPIVNFRVLDPFHYSNKLLNKPAIRVCPSPELTEALISNSMVNGPVHFIPNGIDVKQARGISFTDKTTDLLIVAFKNREFGKKLFQDIKGFKKIKLLQDLMPHSEFLDEMANAKIIIHCPQKIEAHYLPGLEGMLQGGITIAPDCKGNTFYLNHTNDGYICKYNRASILDTYKQIIKLDDEQLNAISIKATDKAKKYSLQYEKQMWHHLLNALTNH